MTFNPERHHRRSIRLRGHNYAQAGAYFITICTKNGEHLFGEVIDGVMHLNDAGKIVAEEWSRSPSVRSEIVLEEWVVMPNHLHGIVIIQTTDRGDNRGDDRQVAASRPTDPTPTDRGCRGDRPVAPTSRSTDRTPTNRGDDRQVATSHFTDRTPTDRGCRGDRPVAPTSRSTVHPSGPPSRSIGAMIAGFKSAASKRINEMRGTPGLPVWQRNYYESIIRNTESLDRVRKYIRNNPAKWTLERERTVFEEIQTIEQMARMDAEREIPTGNEPPSEKEIRKNLGGLGYGG
jgi:REP element-mobilizing transposase RayT